MQDFGALNLPVETVTQVFFLFVLGVYAAYTAVLYYHWNTYGTDAKVTNLTLILYFVTTLPLLLVMGLMLLIL